MGCIRCQCGKLISNNSPEVQIYAYPSTQWENEIDTLDLVHTLDIPEPELLIWRCPKCRRLYVFPRLEAGKVDKLPRYSDHPIIYKVEKDCTQLDNPKSQDSSDSPADQ